jgi:hypothetical protein
MLRQMFSQRTHQIHPIVDQSQVLGHFGPFRYYMNFGVKLAKLVSLMHKIVQQSRIRISRNERTTYSSLDPKLMFWGISDRSITAEVLSKAS